VVYFLAVRAPPSAFATKRAHSFRMRYLLAHARRSMYARRVSTTGSGDDVPTLIEEVAASWVFLAATLRRPRARAFAPIPLTPPHATAVIRRQPARTASRLAAGRYAHAHHPLWGDAAIHVDPAGLGKDNAVPDLRARLIGGITGSASRIDDNTPTAIVNCSAGRGGNAGQCQNTDAHKIVGHKCLAFRNRALTSQMRA